VLPAPGFSLRWAGGFSPNSRYLKAHYWREGEGFSARVWDVDQQKAVLEKLPGHSAAEFNSDSRLFVFSNPDGTISVYDLGSGKELKRLPGARQFQRLVLNPSNTKLACFDEWDSSVEIREIESGRIVFTLPCPALVITAAWSPDGKRLATACADHRIYVLDAENGQQLAILEGHDARIMNLVFNHAGDLLASAGFEGLFRFWDSHTGRPIASYAGCSWNFQFSPDDRQLEGWQNVSQYGLLEVASSRECRILFGQPQSEGYTAPAFSADGRIVAAATVDRVCFWDVYSGKKIASFPLMYCDAHIFHPDGHSLIYAYRSGGVRLRTLERVGGPASSAYLLGKPRQFLDMPDVREAALSLDGRHLAVTHQSDGESFIFDLLDSSAKVVLRGHPFVDYIAISPDGRWAATASWQNSLVKIWDARSGDLLRTLSMPARTRVAFSPDGRWLATSTTKYQLWGVGSWQPKGPAMPGHPVAQFNFTAFSPDGRVMARTTEGHNIKLQEVSTARLLATLEAPGLSLIISLRFSPDGSRLAATGTGPQIQLWDLRLIRQDLRQMQLDWDLPPYPPLENAATPGPVTLQVEPDPSNPPPAQ
jgi:WD40 repeat protein